MSIEDSDLDWPTAVPEMKSAVIPVLAVARKYFRKIKHGDCRALSSQGRFTDVQCSHLIARSPCDFCPKRRSILIMLSLVAESRDMQTDICCCARFYVTANIAQ